LPRTHPTAIVRSAALLAGACVFVTSVANVGLGENSGPTLVVDVQQVTLLVLRVIGQSSCRDRDDVVNTNLSCRVKSSSPLERNCVRSSRASKMSSAEDTFTPIPHGSNHIMKTFNDRTAHVRIARVSWVVVARKWHAEGPGALDAGRSGARHMP
jgi:hypothetical protein